MSLNPLLQSVDLLVNNNIEDQANPLKGRGLFAENQFGIGLNGRLMPPDKPG